MFRALPLTLALVSIPCGCAEQEDVNSAAADVPHGESVDIEGLQKVLDRTGAEGTSLEMFGMKSLIYLDLPFDEAVRLVEPLLEKHAFTEKKTEQPMFGDNSSVTTRDLQIRHTTTDFAYWEHPNGDIVGVTATTTSTVFEGTTRTSTSLDLKFVRGDAVARANAPRQVKYLPPSLESGPSNPGTTHDSTEG